MLHGYQEELAFEEGGEDFVGPTTRKRRLRKTRGVRREKNTKRANGQHHWTFVETLNVTDTTLYPQHLTTYMLDSEGIKLCNSFYDCSSPHFVPSILSYRIID